MRRRNYATGPVHACAVALVTALCALAHSVRADVPELAAWFDSTDEEIEAEFAQASGGLRYALGLILADSYTSEKGAQKGLEALALVPGPDELAQAGYTDLATYARSTRATALTRLGRAEEAATHFAGVVEQAASVNAVELRARVYDHLVFYELRRGQTVAAYSYARTASQAAEQTTSQLIRSRVWNNEALIMHMSGMYAQSLQRFGLALESARAVAFRSIDDVISFNLGLSQLETGDFAGALRSFEVGVNWAHQANDAYRLLIAQTHRAMALVALERPAEAVDALTTMLAVQADRADADILANAYRLLGEAQRDLGDLQAAGAAVESGLAIAREGGNTLRELQLKLLRVELLERAGQLDAALAEARTMVAVTAQPAGREHIDALRRLAELEARTLDFAQAYALSRRAEELEQRAKGESYARELAMLAVASDVQRAELLRRQAEEKALKLESESRNSRAIALLSLGALPLLVLVGHLGRERYIQGRLIAEQQRVSRELESQVAERTRALRREMDERLAVEREGAELRDNLALADKLGALGKLTGGVAHDFNNLLTVINGAADILVDKPDLAPAERMRLAHAIASAGEAGADICRGLLAYARRQPLNPKVLDVREHIESLQSLLEQTLGDGVSLHMDIEAARVRVDPAQLTTAIINLLSNAREAMQGEGKVSIRVRQDPSSGRVVIEVADTGCGMSPNEVVRASEPFYSTKESSVATGLGLSVVQGFIHQSGGELEIESEPGAGTRMRLLLPPCDGGSERVLAPPAGVATQHDGAIRTLLVDDNDAVASMLSSMLKLIGHDVLVARSPERALEVLDDNEVDLLVSDVVMPGSMNGVELARHALERTPRLRVLLLSGYVNDSVSLPYPFLPKPFSQELFRKTIEEVMADQQQSVGMN